MEFFWQDLFRLLRKLCKIIIILAGIAFFSLAAYYRPDIHVKNIFQLSQVLQDLKSAKTNIYEKIEKIADENKKLNKETQNLKRENNGLKEKNQNLQKQINYLEERLKVLEKKSKENESEEDASSNF